MVNNKNTKEFIMALLILDVIYVFLEIMLNSSVLELASGLVFDKDKVESIENFGRTLSGVGLGLAIFSMIKLPRSGSRKLISFLVIVSLSIPFMHKIQDYIVEDIVVSNSSAATRANAELIVTYRDGMTLGLYGLGKGIPFDKQNPSNPDELSMTSVFSLSIFNDHSSKTLRGGYDYFSEAKLSEKDKYTDQVFENYQKASNYYKSAMSVNNEMKSNKGVSQGVIIASEKEFMKLKEAARISKATIDDKEKELYNYLLGKVKENEGKAERSYFFKRGDYKGWNTVNAQFAECRNRSCNILTNELVVMTGIRDFSARRMSTNEFVGRFCKGGCPRNADQYVQRIIKQKEVRNEFKRKTGVYPVSHLSLSSFTSSSVFFNFYSSKVMNGLTMEYDAQFKTCGYKNSFGKSDSSIKKCIVKNASRYDQSKHDEFDLPDFMNGKVSYSESSLLRHADVKGKYQEIMGYLYFPITDLDMTKESFKRKMNSKSTENVIKKNISKRAARNEKDFAAGGSRESEGEAYVKALFIPPVALLFSLFFTFATIARIASRVVDLTFYDSPKRKAISASASVCSLLAVLAMPIMLFPGKFSNDQSIKRLELLRGSEFTVTQSTSIKWVLSAQPIIYRIGEPMLRANGFSRDRH